MDDARYDAFISYSHAADGRLAPALQAGLQRLARPWFKPRVLRVFRDDTGLGVNPHLWDSIATALASSRHFIVLLSPEAAASPWVNREIEQWTATKDPMDILPVLTDGTLVWSGRDYDPEASTALPPALRTRFREEPRHLDLRWARDESQLDLRNSRFREAVADLAAPLHGIPKDELEGEDVRQHRRTRRLARAAVAGLGLLLAVSLVAGALAVVNARDADRSAERAEREATVATARRLAAEAVARAGTAPDQALLLALEARRLQDSVESRSALLTVLQRTDRLERLVTGFRPGEVVAGLSVDGDTAALAGEGGGVRLVDTTTREERRSFETGQQGPVRAFFAPDGRTVATTSDDHTVKVWRDGRPVGRVLRGHDYALRSADFSADATRLVTVDDYGLSALWDVRTGRAIARFPEMLVGFTPTVDLSPDGRAVALSALGTRVFDTATGAPLLEVPNHALVPDAVVAFSPDGTMLAVDDEPGDAVEVWDLRSGAVAQSVDSDVGTVRSLAFSPDGSVLAQGMEDGTVLLWDLVDRRPLDRALTGHSGAVIRLAFARDGTTLVSASSSGVGRWDIGPDGLSLGTRHEAGPLPVDGVDVSPDGEVIATIDFRGDVRFVDALELRSLGPPLETSSAAGGLARLTFSPDGGFLAATPGPVLYRVDARRRSITGEPLALPDEGPVHIGIAASGRVLVLGSLSGGVTVVDVDRWEVVRTYEHPFFGLVFGFDVSRDGSVAAAGGGDGRVWIDGVAEEGSRQLTTGPGPVSGLDFSPDGATLAIGFGDGSVVLVDATSGRRLGPPLSGHSGNITGVRFSPDGRLLAVSDQEGQAVLWDVEGRHRLGELVGHARPGRLSGANDLAFLPDGRALVTAGSDGSIVRWDLDPAHWAERACTVAGRNLALGVAPVPRRPLLPALLSRVGGWPLMTGSRVPGSEVRCVLVSHFHWDREWYRTFEDFRSRLVGAVDEVLDLCAADPGYRFVLDGQAVVLEDYLTVRPGRRDELEALVRQGRLAIGPWYVQADSLLPSGEAQVRNLLEGRRVAGAVGPVSSVAYVPDSFGHPAQFPQLFAGFGLGPFVYWRGNGDELDRLGPVWRWRAPDGTEVTAWHLTEGYFGAAGLDRDPEVAAERLEAVVRRLAGDGADPVLLMNGFDHLPPDAHTGPVAEALSRRLGSAVPRALLDEAAAMVDGTGAPVFEGPLLGGRIANLLPGVWSARLPLKLRNRACETGLTGWAEPWAALGAAHGLPDERPALREAWRALLRNQAHDSVGGCSLDRVAEQMAGRYDTASELAATTTRRVLEQLAGRAGTGALSWAEEHEVVVFNPSPHVRTGLVRIPLDALPPWRVSIDRFELHPLTLLPPDSGWLVDGEPARAVATTDPTRIRFLPDTAPIDVELVAVDVPAFGCRRYSLRRGPSVADEVDDQREVSAGDVVVRADDDGTLSVSLDGRTFSGLFDVEDSGDRGDSYDFDPVGDVLPVEVADVRVERVVSAGGVQRLRIERTLLLPTGLAPGDEARSSDVVPCLLALEALVVPGVPGVEVTVTFDNRARDHRLRLRFPTGAPAATCTAATTFDHGVRSTAPVDSSQWLHPAGGTFPHQGWMAANGLVVGAPGLPEAEVSPDGTILVTLARSVGWLARFDVRSRPFPAGPEMRAPGAQVQEVVTARFALATDPAVVRDAELGLRAVLGGPAPLLEAGTSLLSLEPAALVLSACAPADDGDGFVVRVLNPTDDEHEAVVRLGVAVAGAQPVRLDESPSDEPLARDDGALSFPVPPHALRSVRVRPG